MINLGEIFNNNVSDNIKKNILFIIDTYKHYGFECWLVGGTVRDLLLGYTPHDFDFTTNCPLEITKKIFPKVIPTGEDHGTLTIHISGINYEVTRYRKDVATDGRRAVVSYSDSLEEDLLRRDFTINSIAFNPKNNKIVDITGGLNDIENRVLKFVGDVNDRIHEDHLRYMRLLRFKVKYNFTISDETMLLAQKMFDASKLSLERIYDEFNKIFLMNISDYNKKFICKSLHDKLKLDLLFNNDKTSNKILFDMLELNSLYPMVYYNGYIPELRLSGYFKKLSIGVNYIASWDKNISTHDLKKILAHTKKDLKLAIEIIRIHGYYIGMNLDKYISSLKFIYQTKEPILVTDLNINGNDLESIGIPPNKMGIVLNALLLFAYDYPIKNNKSILLKRANNIYINNIK